MNTSVFASSKKKIQLKAKKSTQTSPEVELSEKISILRNNLENRNGQLV